MIILKTNESLQKLKILKKKWKYNNFLTIIRHIKDT